jgi:hypothetical protein
VAIRTSPPPAVVSGPILFARYAYPPNRLGLCGPDDAPALIGSALGGAEREVRALAHGFEGAYPYLQLIADENGIPDPLDPRVVEGYWLGNELTARVGARALHRNVDERFRRRMDRRSWHWLEEAVAAGSWPVHAFHVLEVYPRVGLMRGGDGGPVLAAMDACRIRWGRVLATDGEQLEVETQPLRLADGQLTLGEPRVETVRGWVGASGLLDGAVVGDLVSVHWGWACDRLTGRQALALSGWTRAALAVANESV